LFFFWLRYDKDVRTGFWVWFAIAIAMGLTQWLLQRQLGLDGMVMRYGLVFVAARDGQLWRFVVGPFFHSSALHYMGNATSVIFIGPLLWALLRKWSLVAFMVGNVAGGYAEMLYDDGSTYDAYVGISAGIFTLCGFLFTASLINRRLLPTGVS